MSIIEHLYTMFSFRLDPLLLLLAISIILLSACSEDDDNMLSSCPPPPDAFVLSTCLLDIPDMLRPEDKPDVTFKVDLYLSGDNYYYAFLSSSISAPIEVYDACCNSICKIGAFGPQIDPCEWIDSAEELGRIWEE